MLPLLKRQKDIFEALKNRLKSAEGSLSLSPFSSPSIPSPPLPPPPPPTTTTTTTGIDKNVVGQAITTCQDHLKNAVGIIKAVLAQNGEFYDDFAPEIDAAASAVCFLLVVVVVWGGWWWWLNVFIFFSFSLQPFLCVVGSL